MTDRQFWATLFLAWFVIIAASFFWRPVMLAVYEENLSDVQSPNIVEQSITTYVVALNQKGFENTYEIRRLNPITLELSCSNNINKCIGKPYWSTRFFITTIATILLAAHGLYLTDRNL